MAKECYFCEITAVAHHPRILFSMPLCLGHFKWAWSRS